MTPTRFTRHQKALPRKRALWAALRWNAHG